MSNNPCIYLLALNCFTLVGRIPCVSAKDARQLTCDEYKTHDNQMGASIIVSVVPVTDNLADTERELYGTVGCLVSFAVLTALTSLSINLQRHIHSA